MATNLSALAEALSAIETGVAPRKLVRQSTPAEMAAARRAAQAPRDAANAATVARLAAAPQDMSALTDDQLSGLIYDAIALRPRDAGYDMGQAVSIRAHAERQRRAAACPNIYAIGMQASRVTVTTEALNIFAIAAE